MDALLALQFKNSSIGEAWINIKGAITKALEQGGVFGLIQVPIILAAGIAQITSMARAFIQPPIKFSRGGMVHGALHGKGGVQYSTGGRIIELEGGEAVINKHSTSMYRDQLSAINQAGGCVRFQQGGILPRGANLSVPPTQTSFVPVLVTDDLHTVEARIKVTEERATL